MELDETDPAVWLKLEGAVDEYIQNNSLSFKNVCERLLLPFHQDEKWSENLKSLQFPVTKASKAGICYIFFIAHCGVLDTFFNDFFFLSLCCIR